MNNLYINYKYSIRSCWQIIKKFKTYKQALSHLVKYFKNNNHVRLYLNNTIIK